ncbi:hypothetical protein [Aquimonas voraii]|uniref:Yip1 domain-containing protein n=1 Tax=Aquimonas voraii TaxID=265719 RepID=A0A1G6UJI1_9GAMM|nr:hypothetical protein [Aquimonas voraii]SDD41512.1 hypothetical protein SAMN04488509_102369 [Aquimonas voraii]
MVPQLNLWTELPRDVGRLLTFRRMGPGVRSHAGAYLGFGLAMSWLAGIGRYRDNPRAELWQLAGLGSVAYVFSLALLLWLLILPLRARRWSYRNVLLFVCLTSPPALLYAIPVERFMSGEAALATNAWFLGIVASWRVALLLVFLKRDAGLQAWEAIVACLLPLALIVVSLALLNLEHVVFNLMSGIRAEDQSANDAAYGVVVLLSLFSFVASPLLAIAYLWLVFHRRQFATRPR